MLQDNTGKQPALADAEWSKCYGLAAGAGTPATASGGSYARNGPTARGDPADGHDAEVGPGVRALS